MQDKVIFVSADGVDEARRQTRDAIEYIRDELETNVPEDYEEGFVVELHKGEQAMHRELNNDGYVIIGANHPGVRDGAEGPAGPDLVRSHIHRPEPKDIIFPTIIKPSVKVVHHSLRHNCNMHFVDERMTFHRNDAGLTGAALDAAEAACSSPAGELDVVNRQWRGGRPPLGCTVEDGRLVEGEDYDQVRQALQRVRKKEMSKTAAAEEIGSTRKTVSKAAERTDLYRLD